MLSAMQFESFIWPHNPRTYRIGFVRNLVQHPLPGVGYSLEDLGMNARVMEGVGEFYGKDAYKTLGELASLFYRGKPGLLLHPLWQSSQVYFDRFEVLEEPREDYVRYAFRFVEAPEPVAESAAAQQSVILSAGQTLWSVAQQYEVSTAELLARNPQLRTCHDAAAGKAVRLR